MLLQNRQTQFSIPHTSTCIIRTSGDIHDGDVISVVSPVFASTDFQSGSIKMTEEFDVPIRITNESRILYDTGEERRATLVCDDNDVFHMYVRIP